MRIFARHYLKTHGTLAALFARALKLAPSYERILFQFTEPSVKIEPFGYGKFAGNLGEPWMDAHPKPPVEPVDPAFLRKLLKHRMKAAAVILDGVPWDGRPPAPAAKSTPVWIPLGAGHYLRSCLALAVTEGIPGLVAIAENGRIHRKLGPVDAVEWVAGFEPEEKAAHDQKTLQAEKGIAEFDPRTVPFPHELAPDGGPLEMLQKKSKPIRLGSFKGYRRVSPRVFCRRTRSGHHLHARVMLFAIKRLQCLWEFVGLETRHAFALPCSLRDTAYNAPDQMTVDRVMANWSTALDELEAKLVPKLIEAYGAEPKAVATSPCMTK